jgi:hypothetical protein
MTGSDTWISQGLCSMASHATTSVRGLAMFLCHELLKIHIFNYSSKLVREPHSSTHTMGWSYSSVVFFPLESEKCLTSRLVCLITHIRGSDRWVWSIDEAILTGVLGEKSAQVPNCPPNILCLVSWDWTRASSVWSWRVARPVVTYRWEMTERRTWNKRNVLCVLYLTGKWGPKWLSCLLWLSDSKAWTVCYKGPSYWKLIVFP